MTASAVPLTCSSVGDCRAAARRLRSPSGLSLRNRTFLFSLRTVLKHGPLRRGSGMDTRKGGGGARPPPAPLTIRGLRNAGALSPRNDTAPKRDWELRFENKRKWYFWNQRDEGVQKSHHEPGIR